MPSWSRTKSNPFKLDYSLRTLHHYQIELDHSFAAIAHKLLSNSANVQCLKECILVHRLNIKQINPNRCVDSCVYLFLWPYYDRW